MEQIEKKSGNIGYKITIILLLVIIAILVWLLLSVKTQNTKVVNEKEIKAQVLMEELNSLMAEHDSIKIEYAQLADKISQKDSIIKNQATEIQNLIIQQADYKRIKKKLAYLRNITQGYVHQIDSLFKVNQALKNENINITHKYEKTQQANIELQKDKEQLSEKVSIASVLKAANISVTPLRVTSRNKEKSTDRASKADRIKVCFTLMENPVAPAGIRTVYVRIARPDKKIICEGVEDIYSFEFNEQRLQYTLKKDINYDNKAQSMCLEWNKKDKSQEAMKGTYDVLIYADNNMIGEVQFALR